MVWIRSRNRSQSRNRNFSKVGIGTVKIVTVPQHWSCHYGSECIISDDFFNNLKQEKCLNLTDLQAERWSFRITNYKTKPDRIRIHKTGIIYRVHIIDAILFSGRRGRGNGLLDEGGEYGPEHLVGSLLGRLRFQVQVQKISAIQTIVYF